MEEQDKKTSLYENINTNNEKDMEDIIANLTNIEDDTKILLLNKLKETKEILCNSFRKQFQEKEQECEKIKK